MQNGKREREPVFIFTALDAMKPRERFVYVEDGCFLFSLRPGYFIPVKDIKSWKDIVRISHHLAEKMWIRREATEGKLEHLEGEVVAQFIECACYAKGFNLYGGA